MKLFSIFISVLVPILAVEMCLAQPDRWNARHKDRYLEDFKKCERSAPTPNCHMGTVINVVISYREGDLHVLQNLMDAAGNKADYMEESLGWFFSELLCEQPRTFLTAVAGRPGIRKVLNCVANALHAREIQTEPLPDSNKY
ncbi:MAG: hypothetical protein H0U23_00335 [Blastocatellia bacterium]|nr:hypothetical protein [Blastocatellia bacterium]